MNNRIVKRSHRPRKHSRQRGKGTRERRQCPICSLEIVHMPRHFRDAHDFSRYDSLAQARSIRTTVIFPGTKSNTEIESVADASMDDNSTIPQISSIPVLQEYFAWLKSIERNKTHSEALNRVNIVFKIWTCIDPSISLASITNGNLVRDTWIQRVKNKLAPGTIKAYLGFLKDFYSFLKSCKMMSDIGNVIDQTSRWIANITKSSRQRIIELRIRESEERLEPSDIQRFIESKVSVRCQSLLEEPFMNEDITRHNYTLMRNYLIILIIIHNGQRVGAIRNFNVRNFQNSEERNNNIIAIVSAHKTAHLYPATLVFSKSLWMWMKNFITSVRPKLPGFTAEHELPESPVFLTWPKVPGEKPSGMTDTNMNYAINAIWKQAGVSKKSISATKFRKATTTSVRRVNPEVREALAAQMTHRPSTADKYYLLEQSKDDAIRVVDVIKNIMIPNRMQKTQCIDPSQSDSESSSQIVAEDTENTQVDGKEDSLNSGVIIPNSIQKHRRRAFSEEDSSIILKLCRDMIKRGGSVVYSSVLFRMQNNPEGRAVIAKYFPIYGKQLWKKIADRVRTEMRKQLQ